MLAPPGSWVFGPAGRAPVLEAAQTGPMTSTNTARTIESVTERAGGALVLVVEDDAEMNRLLCESLAPEHRVATAFDGKEGLQKAIQVRPDLILTEVAMPGMSGDELVQAIRSRPDLERTPVVLLTAKAGDELCARLLREGAQDCLTKPFSVEELRARVNHLISRKRALEIEAGWASLVERESEERFRLAFEDAPIGMALVDLDGRFVRVNRVLCELVGYSPEELTGRTFQAITHPDDLDADLSLAGQLLRGEIPRYQLEKRYIHKDGAIVDVMLSASMLRGVAGEPLYYISQIEDITARKRLESRLRVSEAQLRQSKERLELALRGANLGSWDWNIQSGEVLFDSRWAEMRGFRLDEIESRVESWISGIHPDDWPRVQGVLDDYFQGRVAEYETEHRVRTKSGEWIWVLDRGKVFTRDERGQPLRMVGTELDITCRKRAEEKLRFAEATSSGILSIAADAIICLDEDQRITLFNEGAAKIFGYSREEPIGAPLDILVPERLRADHRRHVATFAADGRVARRMGERGAAIVGLRKSGEEFPAEAAISRLEVDGKQVLTVALRDITEQKRIEREQRFLVEVGSVLATTLDYQETLSKIAELAVRELADFCIVDIAAEGGEVRRLTALGRDRDKEWISAALMRAPIDRKRPHLVWSALETRKPVLVEDVTPEMIAFWSQSEEHLEALRGLAPRSIITVPLLAHGDLLGVLALVSSTRAYGPPDLHLAEELAHRAALSIENARLYLTAKRAVQARDDVLGIVAHDLRNPLSSIVMQVARLRRPGAEAERRSPKAVDAIERAANRMNRLIQDLLDVTRMEAGCLSVEQGRLHTVQVVSDALAAQKPLASSASLELRLDLAPDLPDVWADRDRLLQVLENLIGNALKFTAPGGRITVGAAPRDGEVLFRVADTGSGIAAEDLPHLFDRFWQARKTGRRGAGLGLPIVKGIVEAHGGRVWVESTPGRGSTFFFTIPTRWSPR